MGSNIAYVASTLPIHILNIMVDKWGVSLILVTSDALQRSCSYLKSTHSEIRIIVVPKNRLLGIIWLSYHLALVKLSKRRVYFFHECCCIYFDIIVGFIKPKGFLYPQVTLTSFPECPISEIRFDKHKIILNLLRLSGNFTPHLMYLDNDHGRSVVWERTSYPSSIVKFTVDESCGLKIDNNQYDSIATSKKILFLVGADFVSTETLYGLYVDIIDRLSELDYRLYVKDHPNPESRLNIVDDRLVDIDPYMPVELLDEQFDFVIGSASTGLLLYKEKGISVLRIVDTTNQMALENRLLHLTEMPDGNFINFPVTIEQLIGIIKETLIY